MNRSERRAQAMRALINRIEEKIDTIKRWKRFGIIESHSWLLEFCEHPNFFKGFKELLLENYTYDDFLKRTINVNTVLDTIDISTFKFYLIPKTERNFVLKHEEVADAPSFDECTDELSVQIEYATCNVIEEEERQEVEFIEEVEEVEVVVKIASATEIITEQVTSTIVQTSEDPIPDQVETILVALDSKINRRIFANAMKLRINSRLNAEDLFSLWLGQTAEGRLKNKFANDDVYWLSNQLYPNGIDVPLLIYACPGSGKTTFNDDYGDQFRDTDLMYYWGLSYYPVVLTNMSHLISNNIEHHRRDRKAIVVIPSRSKFRERCYLLSGYTDKWYYDLIDNFCGIKSKYIKVIRSDDYLSDIMKNRDMKLMIQEAVGLMKGVISTRTLIKSKMKNIMYVE